MTVRERCPYCRALLPPPKTCPECERVFYRSEGGRRDAVYCSAKCATKARVRRFRRRNTDK